MAPMSGKSFTSLAVNIIRRASISIIQALVANCHDLLEVLMVAHECESTLINYI